MKTIFGIVFVFVCVIGGYLAAGGHIGVLIQPFEFVIIFGAAVGAYLIANPKHVVKHTGKGLGSLFKKPSQDKSTYIELLSLLYTIFKTVRSKGWLVMEQHIEKPDESELFKKFPSFYANHHAREFLCDYLRIVSLGSSNPHEMDALMESEIETLHHEHCGVSHALQNMADGMPALGIVAAVLGVIKTMGAISEPPEVLGHLIGAALVGTFLGVLLSYGFVGPMSNALESKADADIKYYHCMKAGLLAFLQGAAAPIAVEHARKALMSHVRPSFLELEEATSSVSAM